MYQQCTRCVMDTIGDQTISFNSDGFCNYCEDTLRRKDSEYFPTEQGQELLERIFDQIKSNGRGKDYDCLVGVSGGLDSSYVIYLGHQYGLRMLAVHIDDGYNTKIAESNIHALCAKASADLEIVKPDKSQFADVIRAFFRASVPGLAAPQDNIIMASLRDLSRGKKIAFNLGGSNFALESILLRDKAINACDKRHITDIHKQFGENPIPDLRFIGLVERYIYSRYFSRTQTIYPLNYIDYNRDRALSILKEFSGYNYYGGKHFESVLTRFLQCFYLPEKYGVDKRKSHFSSMIVSEQMSREEALELLSQNQYLDEVKEHDFNYIAESLELTRKEFDDLVALPPRQHTDYKTSRLNMFGKIARRYRKYLGA